MSALRRVRTAGGRRVVDMIDWCRADVLTPAAMAARRRAARSTRRSPQRGLTVHHGVATITPDVAMGEVARRLAVPRGTLLLKLWQVDSTADGESRSSRASTTWPTPSRSPSTGAAPATGARRSDERRSGRRRRRRLAGHVRAGDRRRRHPRAPPATCRTRSPTRSPAGPSRIRASGSAPSPRRWPRCAARSAAGRCARSRSARSWTGWWRPAADGEPAGPALIWMDRRAGAECDAAAEPHRPAPACAR